MSSADANTDSGFAHLGFAWLPWPGLFVLSAEVHMVQQRSYPSIAGQIKRCVEDLTEYRRRPHVLAALLQHSTATPQHVLLTSCRKERTLARTWTTLYISLRE